MRRATTLQLILRSVALLVIIGGVGLVGYTKIVKSSAQTPSLSSAQLFSGMPLALDEEFAGNSLNTNIWTPKNNYKASNNEAYWMASNVVVNNGLQIRADQNQNGHAYEAADLQTYSDKWMTSNNYFGAEVRAKLPLQTGFWPAPLWFRPVASNGSVTNGEIDMMEGYGSEKPNYRLHGTLHGTYSPNVQSAKAVTYASLGLDPFAYHTWQMVKVPGSLALYVDGIQFAKWTSNSSDSNYWAPFSQYMEAAGVRWGMRITTQIGGSYGLPNSTTDWSSDASTMFISYVKIYNYNPSSTTPSTPSTPTTTPTKPASPTTAPSATTTTTSPKPASTPTASPAITSTTPAAKPATVVQTASGQSVRLITASTSVAAGDTITLDSASVTNATAIKQVAFYKGSTLLMEVTAPPYVLDLKKIPAGKLPNGPQRITQKTYYTDGQVSEQSQLITIKGQPAAARRPASRTPATIGSLSALALIGAMVWLFGFRRRNLTLRGLGRRASGTMNQPVNNPSGVFAQPLPPQIIRPDRPADTDNQSTPHEL